MGKCGCSNICSCYLEDGRGTKRRGNGSAATPYRVDVNIGEVCGDVMACVCSNTGPGVTCGSGKIQAKLSSTEGNGISFGEDGGLYGLCSGHPCPGTGGATVDGLPETGILCGFRGAGMLIAPENLISSYELAVTQGLDMADVRVRVLGDGTPVVHAADTVTTESDGFEFPSVIGLKTMTATRWQELRFIVGQDPGGNSYLVDPARGYFGHHRTPVAGGPLLDELLATVGGQIVLMCEPIDAAAAAPLLDRIVAYGLTKSVIVRTTMALGPMFSAAGIPTCAYVASNDTSQIQAVKDAGFTWVCLSGYMADGVTDATITAWADAGMNVLGWNLTAHYQRARWDAAGVRGAVSQDPIYYSGQPARYRHANPVMDHFPQHYPHHGMLSPLMWTGGSFYSPVTNASANMNQLMRGYYINYTGNSSWADLYLPRGTGNGAFGVLQGYLAPNPVPMPYTYKFGARFVDAPRDPGRFVGGVVCAMTDRPWSDRLPRVDAQVPMQGYSFGLRYNGSLAAWKYGPYVPYPEIASGVSPRPGVRYWFHCRVSADQITIGVSMAANVMPTRWLTINDTQYRGDYVHVLKHEGNAPFRSSYYNVQLVPGLR